MSNVSKLSLSKGGLPVVVDLFAGCGGLSLGLENSGFFPVFVNELNRDAMESYLVNRDRRNPMLRSRFNVNDIKDLVVDDHKLADLISGLRKSYSFDPLKGELDLLVGGPPCQGFSGIGYRRSYSVDKAQLPSNHLYQDMAYVVSRLRPRIFLFENVRGLLTARWTSEGTKGEIWNDVQSTFTNLDDYDVHHKLVYAKDYGVPQNRPRVLLVGIRKDLSIKNINPIAMDAVEGGFLPRPSGNAPDLCELFGDIVDPDYENGGETTHYPSPASAKIQRNLRTNPETGRILPKGSRLTEHEYSCHSPHIVEKFAAMLANGGEIPPEMRTKKFAQRLLPKTWDLEGPTITATSLPDDYVHFSQPRSLTVREWARLQMFPDWYRFSGKRTTGGLRRAGNPQKGLHDREVPKYTQIGNAVPVGLGEAVGKHFLHLLTKN